MIGCRQTKYVPAGRFLLNKNEIIQSGDKLDGYELEEIIRQKPNYRSFGVKWKLMAYNAIDSAKVANKRFLKNTELREENKKRLIREDRINAKRIAKATNKNREFYTHKTIQLKDTADPRMFFREWYKYKLGRPPVVFDSIPYRKTIEQFEAYLKTKGYYYGSVKAIVLHKNNRKCAVTYHVTSGERFYIDSVYEVIENVEVANAYNAFKKLKQDLPLIGKPFDADLLDDYRGEVARFMRDSSFYSFASTSITYIADTVKSSMKVNLGIVFSDRAILVKNEKDSVLLRPYKKTKIEDVYFHIADTMFSPNFSGRIAEKGLSTFNGQFLRTLDTMYYSLAEDKRSHADEINRTAIFLYNDDLFVKPRVLEMFNYLDTDGPYKEKYVENSYNSLLRLGVFKAIKTELKEDYSNNSVTVNHYLVPNKRQSFGFEPRATNSNGFLGVSASINYTNRNLFRGAERLTFSLSGGFESQPPIFEETLDGEKVKTEGRSFNTLELGPSVKLEIPGFYPFRFSRIATKNRPQTIVSAAYNFQKRTDFIRGTFQMNYAWRFILSKTSIIQSGLPGASVVKFVNIEKSDDFDNKLEVLNDVFLKNAYSNQFVWLDWKFIYEYNIKEKENRSNNFQLYYKTTFDPAGTILSMFRQFQDTVANGQYGINGIGYSQFLRIDNEVIVSKPLSKERSLNFKAIIGGGLPYGNTTTSLPYDYSFFAGGANDNRGWSARALGPGTYKYYLDTNRTSAQIGDIRLGAFAEYRFSFNAVFKGAFFLDGGNIWSIFYDENRPGGQISKNFLNELSLATGFGLRVDLEFFILRLDLGLPVRNPALPNGAQWIFQSRYKYYQEGKDFFGINYEEYMPFPFRPTVHFGIGYPF